MVPIIVVSAHSTDLPTGGRAITTASDEAQREIGGSRMNSEELRALQAPLKARYRDTPDTALITLRAEGEIGDATVTCKVETGRAQVEAGLHPASGGDGLAACSGDMLLEALVGFRAIRLSFELDTDASPDQVATLMKLTERYCVILQTLRSPPNIITRQTAGAAA